MKTLCSVIFTSLIVGSLSCISAQSDEYVIESFQDEYIALTDYQSVAKLAFGNPIFEVALPLNFQFPFYGAYYDTIIYNTDAWGSLTNNQDVALLLMDFTRGYAWDWVVDTLNITSDIRFAHVLTNGIQAFVLQYTKMGFFADPVEEFDPSMNFQLWFFENGIVEVHFGEMNMNGTPIYDPGEGFYCYTTSGGVDMSEVCGPHMGISDPLNEEDAIALSGSWDNYEVVGDQYAVLNTLPPVGWVIRFEPRALGLFEPDYEINEISMSPIPASSFINLAEPGVQVTVYTLSGEVIYQGITNENTLDVSAFPSGIYFLNTLSERGTSIGKFVKN
jgi:Secretion system C-terminal sorting domain